MRAETPDGRRWIGRVLRDKWRIDARISRGGVGTVYAATHKNNGSRAAIKVLHPEFSRDVDTRSRFLQEGYAANQVNHPGVVRILDDDTSEDGHAYLVMELLEGELLETRRVRKGGRLPIADAFEVGEQLLDVLAAAHEKGIVHRDIKPDNLFVTNEGRLKVLDFGFAQIKSSFRTEQTATGFLLGTPGFMSPEQAIGNRPQIDAQTDIWAVGATLFTLLSGQPVHAGESAAEMLVAAANFDPRSLATVTSGLNPRLVSVVDRAVAFEKGNRWPNARSMQFALRDAAGQPSSGQVSRRSIPADVAFDDGSFEELHPDELVDSKGSWSHPGVDATVVARARVPAAALPSEITREDPPQGRQAHPADDDGPTLAVASPRLDASDYGALYRCDDGMGDAASDGGTLIMESPAAAYDDAYPPPPLSPMSISSAQPFGQTQGSGQPPQRASFPNDPRHISSPDLQSSERNYGPAPTGRVRPQDLRAPSSGPSRVLVFIAVAVATMVVVIAAGLVILAVSD